jgi:hypothetical protein
VSELFNVASLRDIKVETCESEAAEKKPLAFAC